MCAGDWPGISGFILPANHGIPARFRAVRRRSRPGQAFNAATETLCAANCNKAGLVFTGLCAGVLISLNFSANADKSPLSPLPVEELRNLADVFNAIKQGYVEPVEDKKLITMHQRNAV